MTASTELRMAERPKSSKKKIFIPLAIGIAIAAGAGTYLVTQQPSAEPEAPKPLVVETGQVTKGDLIEQVRVPGKLGFSGQRDLGTELTGTITGLPKAGTTIAQGQELFRIDDRPITMLTGELPVWRGFAEKMTNGRDIKQLEASLASLGFFEFEPDEKFTAATSKAIKAWQKSVGLKQTGSIELGRIVFLPNEVRVQATKSAVGDQASTAIITVADVDKTLEAMIDTVQQDLAPIGATVDIMLPGGAQTTGTVLSHGEPTEVDGGSGPSVKIPVQIELDTPEAVADLDNVTVSILLTQVRAQDVLLVPTAALLAQNGGGFAVEVSFTNSAGAADARVVPVKLGAFANGLVEVTSGEINPGDTIVVAQ